MKKCKEIEIPKIEEVIQKYNAEISTLSNEISEVFNKIIFICHHMSSSLSYLFFLEKVVFFNPRLGLDFCPKLMPFTNPPISCFHK